MYRHTIKVMVKFNPTIALLSELYNSRLPRVLSNPAARSECWTPTKASRSSTTDWKFYRGNLFYRIRMWSSYPCFSQTMRGPRSYPRIRVSYSSKMRGPCPMRDSYFWSKMWPHVLPFLGRDSRISDPRREIRVLRQAHPMPEVCVSIPREVCVLTKQRETHVQNGMSSRHISQEAVALRVRG